MTDTRVSFLVIYCSDLHASRDFYTTLGLTFEREQHGSGPVHFAATMPDGTVFELYPASARRATGPLRLGLVVDHTQHAAPGLPPGNHVLRDPDGRVLDVLVTDSAARWDETH